MAFINKTGAAVMGLSLALASGTALADSTVSLRILETTDIHTHLVNYDYYRDGESDTVGLAKVATLLKAARGEAENVVFVDNGDLIQGNPLGDYMAKERGLEKGETHPVYKAMNLWAMTRPISATMNSTMVWNFSAIQSPGRISPMSVPMCLPMTAIMMPKMTNRISSPM